MLFALFFGAGNLIFPVMLGQLSGEYVWIASLGFVCTGVFLPLLGVIALGFSGESDFLKVSQRAGVIFGIVFATSLYLSIGPLFAMPRTGSVSYEIGIRPFINPEYSSIALPIFTVIYFGLCCLLSINPNRIVDIVGKFLTPLMLLFIAILVISTVISPMGEPIAAVTPAYQENAFFTGFTNGYLTMDTLASFIFGIIVIYSIAKIGIKSRSSILSACIKASLIAGFLLAVVYVSLAYIGATSVTAIGVQENGGQVLSKVSTLYFGVGGNAVLGVIVLMACLTTSIGLTTACSNYFQKLIPSISYRAYAVLFSIISALFANVGLTQLISISVPILCIVYPLTIVLIILTFTHKMFGGKKLVYIGAMYFTLCISIFDGFNAANIEFPAINQLFDKYLPLYSDGVGWIVPAFVGGVLGYFVDILCFTSKRTKISQ
ncbi:branched-chain amino acid transport system II carrier protein [Zophobihabitans entericus]|uniref:Branched-chain amino acid transport system carrier protein n=1 Tax=Zophobihabitans entericus TaxID=1635327 RepID=A0A6G9IE23_9GAMM|nr:branched-chain amino acid transport system II carrier protein [Zophobihabitans entericus]